MSKFLFAALLLLTFGCAKPKFEKDWTTEKAPEKFTAKFETTKGAFEVEIERKNSPKAVDRFYQLLNHNYFDNSIFYRVLPQYIAQFGNSDQAISDQWRLVKIPDEPVILPNKKGTITFARFGKETRDLELFININDNPELDTVVVEGVKGYPALGRVIKGMEVVQKLYSGYNERTMQDSERMYANRQDFLATYPNLDQIKTAKIIP
ncbi:peptidylprolyl isomerase [Flavobacterium sp.]|uniref:peptidylprolyl isomerase n=1 Tax=Flavobacterium sp. TaxID=239 RepID=UPI001214541E|nr:peptidylprolyl isomerase [Flavobacterium sp.]RZJ70404.1 MAG: peptidylprolyl isomerase [Flavobacterium sp.]